MKKLKQITGRTVRFIRKIYRECETGILLGLGAMMVLSVVTLAVAPRGEKIYKSEIVQTSIETQELEKRINTWEEKIWEARRNIAENNKRITLLSEVFSAK